MLFLLSLLHVRLREDIVFVIVIMESEKHPLFVHLVGVIKSHSHLQSQNTLYTMKD